jgi:hypothetical protein
VKDGDEIPPEVKKELEEALPEMVAELTAKDQRIRAYVLDNPGLVDASSREEAAQRIELMGGATADSLTEFNERHGSCLGDLSSHRNKGYVTDTEDSWKWHQVDSKHSL